MKIAVLGTGNVARVLTGRWLSAGHTLSLGSRNPAARSPWLHDYHDILQITDHGKAAAEAEVVVNALPGNVSLGKLSELKEQLSGKILIDVANATEIGSDGFATDLLYPESSLAEELQRALPRTRVVKTLSTLNDSVMANPTAASGPLSVFVSGNDSTAKEVVSSLLADLGWPRAWILDLGGVESAREPEALVLWLVRNVMPALATLPLGITIAR